MRNRIVFICLTAVTVAACNPGKENDNSTIGMRDTVSVKSGYSDVNGLKMYYEIHGSGKPLVLIHGGGSTIETSFGRIIPYLAKDRQVIGLELQAHGHTNDRKGVQSAKQNAADVATLMKDLGISKADFLGYSSGGHALIELALQHPELTDKIILASTFYKRDAAPPQFWDGFKHATIDVMPQALKEGYLKANDSQEGLMNMFNRDVEMMMNFKEWSAEEIKSIACPALIVTTTHDVGSVEHAVEMYRLLPKGELIVLPGAHGEYIGAIEGITGEWDNTHAIGLISKFLNKN